MDQVVTNRFPSRKRWGCGEIWWAAARQPAYFHQEGSGRSRLGSVLTETDRKLKSTSRVAHSFECVTVCDSLWQFVTICDNLWQCGGFMCIVSLLVTRITRIVYDISVWFIYDIFTSIFPFLPVSSGYLPYFVEESEEKDVLARLPLDQLLKDDTESVATKSTDMWHEYSNCQVNGLQRFYRDLKSQLDSIWMILANVMYNQSMALWKPSI